MDIKSKNSNPNKLKEKKLFAGGGRRWVIWFIIIPIFVTAIFMCTYPGLKKGAKERYQNPLETEEFIGLLYQNNYVLYKELYEKVNGKQEDYQNMFLDITVGEERESLIRLEDFLLNSGRLSYREDESSETLERSPEDLKKIYLDYLEEYGYFSSIEECFNNFEYNLNVSSKFLDYKIMDDVTGSVISNTSVDMTQTDAFKMYLKVTYDENGYVDSLKVRGEDSDALLKRASEIGRQDVIKKYISRDENTVGFLSIKEIGPRNCTVYYGVTEENWNKYFALDSFDIEGGTILFDEISGVSRFYLDDTWGLIYDCLSADYTFVLFAVILFGCFLPLGEKKPWDSKIFRMPFEVILCVLYFYLFLRHRFLQNGADLLTGRTGKELQMYTRMSLYESNTLGYALNFLFGVLVAMVLLYTIYNLRQIRELGFGGYIKQYSYIYRFFPYLKRQMKRAYDYMLSFDVSTATNKMIIRILVVNGIIVLCICCFWFFGIVGVIIYSLILYIIMRKYFSDLKKKYEILLQATNRIADGTLNVTITEELGVFEPFKPQIEKIQEGFRNAVEEEVKSQRMKTELITNVSHDLKTPLTAIITYVNLLKEENLTKEQQKEYVDTLERKSLRLKVLIEDLFEVSKANSRNMTVNLVDVDLVNLLKQVQFELEEKFESLKLSIRMNAPEKMMLKLDSQKAYRVYENLLNNVTKYAMEGTRVYFDVLEKDDTVEVVLKNISATELTVNPSELTERFVRGDESRNTEGSGLGLAIAKSFVELMNGKMSIEIDGDLFKVTTVWYK